MQEIKRDRTTEPPAKADRRALITELSRVGNNVNQLARAAHTDRDFLRYW